MATPATSPTAMSPASKTNRGKDQIHWGEGVWSALDLAVAHEMMRTRVGAKFLPAVHVDKQQTTVASDKVIIPVVTGRSDDPALSIDEGDTNRIQEYWVQFRMSVAQVHNEEHEESAGASANTVLLSKLHAVESESTEHHHVTHSHRASTGVSLAMRTANELAQAEDLVLFNGQNAIVNSPLFNNRIVQALDTRLQTNLDLGLLNIRPVPNLAPPPANSPTIDLPANQVLVVHPAQANPRRYADNTLDAIARGVSILQGLGHYEHYALVLNTIPYADLHQSLPNTLIQTVEPVSHLIKAGIYGTGTLPPFDGINAGLPTQIFDQNHNPQPLSTIAGWAPAGAPPATQVLYTGALVSLSGNTMDIVRGKMDDNLDASVTFNQRDANEQYRFRVVERFSLRLKDSTAIVLLLFVDA